MLLKFVAILMLFLTISQISAKPYHIPAPYAHRAVIENAASEALYPEYLKNPFYKTPRVRAALARFSWLSHGEEIVENRIADHVPRAEIYKLLTHAGLAARDDFPYA